MQSLLRQAFVIVGVFVAAFFCAGEFDTLSAQTLQITPNHVLSDETAVIRAAGLQPNERVTIQATLVDGAGERWNSQTEFLADAQGTVDISQQSPVKGSYNEASAMGLIWSMKPERKNVERYSAPRDFAEQVIEFQLMRAGKSIASAQLVQRTLGEGVRQIKVDGHLHGILFIPAGGGRHPGVLVIGGSEGGLQTQKAAWLASHGFATFALAYFRYEDLPTELEGYPWNISARLLRG